MRSSPCRHPGAAPASHDVPPHPTSHDVPHPTASHHIPHPTTSHIPQRPTTSHTPPHPTSHHVPHPTMSHTPPHPTSHHNVPHRPTSRIPRAPAQEEAHILGRKLFAATGIDVATRSRVTVPKPRDFARTETLCPQRTTWGSSAGLVEKRVISRHQESGCPAWSTGVFLHSHASKEERLG